MKTISDADHRDILHILEWVAGGCKDPTSIKSVNLIRKSRVQVKKQRKKYLKIK